MIATVLRWGLAVALLTVIWMHSHWSVALALTLLAVESEVVGRLLRWHGEVLRGEDRVRDLMRRIMQQKD